jgi:broad specificity phosphatase PhoE
MTLVRACALASLVVVVAYLVPTHAADGDATLWKALRSPGHAVLIRHALAPGTGDPAEFRLGDCATQRNLSEAGRQQALAIGERFRRNGIREARVYSSQWCRCLETARLLELGAVEELALLNSFFARAEAGERQTRALHEWLAGYRDQGPLILVTHQVNITALTGVYPAPGEAVVLSRSSRGKVQVLGTLRAD